eukprot:scaffold1083_cov114-Cylindrotheca_fusiformis.AAC.3
MDLTYLYHWEHSFPSTHWFPCSGNFQRPQRVLQPPTMSSTEALHKTKDAIKSIRLRMQPVIEKLNENGFENNTAQAQATVALSIGMLKYMGARLQGKDQGRKADDPLRVELNNMKRVLAEIKKRGAANKPEASEKKTITGKDAVQSGSQAITEPPSKSAPNSTLKTESSSGPSDSSKRGKKRKSTGSSTSPRTKR